MLQLFSLPFSLSSSDDMYRFWVIPIFLYKNHYLSFKSLQLTIWGDESRKYVSLYSYVKKSLYSRLQAYCTSFILLHLFFYFSHNPEWTTYTFKLQKKKISNLHFFLVVCVTKFHRFPLHQKNCFLARLITTLNVHYRKNFSSSKYVIVRTIYNKNLFKTCTIGFSIKHLFVGILHTFSIFWVLWTFHIVLRYNRIGSQNC